MWPELLKIRSADLSRLRDVAYLESLLPELGLNNEALSEFPSHLYPYCGRGLFSWQYPHQFSRYLVAFSALPITSYLEIGVHKGGTFIITTEYLRRFNPGFLRATGVDLRILEPLSSYILLDKQCSFFQVSSQSAEFDLILRPGFDLVLIDGDHRREAVKSDFMKVRPFARHIALHDIASDSVPSVRDVWNEIKRDYATEFSFTEFVEQYPEVQSRTGHTYLGIGLAVAKETR